MNFRNSPSTTSSRIRQLKKYALCLIYNSQEVDGVTWYKVSYDGKIGYLNGDFFHQMTVSEAEEFFQSKRYTEGIANNTASGSSGKDSPTTTGSPTGIVSAEDQKVSEWVNPATGSTVSYEPFDPFATPSPLAENEVENAEFLDSLVTQVKAGTMKEEDLQIEVEKFYKDAADPEGSTTKAMNYIREKLGKPAVTETPSPEPLATEEISEFPQEQSSGGAAGWLIGLGVLAAAGGGGYYWYAQTQRKRKAAQRLAQKKAAQQRSQQAAARPKAPVSPNEQAVSAQNAKKVRTGTYADKTGSTAARPGTSEPQTVRKPYSGGIENPYGRYTSSTADEDPSYTASFKPDAGKESGRRPRRTTEAKEMPEESWLKDPDDFPEDPKA